MWMFCRGQARKTGSKRAGHPGWDRYSNITSSKPLPAAHPPQGKKRKMITILTQVVVCGPSGLKATASYAYPRLPLDRFKLHKWAVGSECPGLDCPDQPGRAAGCTATCRRC
ncbi:hypothetical protein QAD02_013957 [Eretmocerus hayati]|uniref:Uncharacterized protein n=1 Tax=Eretmocerus hayati TaxID=131215 RepID=A0ACC2P459_9HYME|nr:hypothetical protein QAD02_013957 [Eretmocerus hayati]